MEKSFEVDEHGHLKHFEHWDEAWIQCSAKKLGLKEVLPIHREMATLLRQLFLELNRVPPQRIFFKAFNRLPCSHAWNEMSFFKLFPTPDHPMRQLCLLAGCPLPSHCL